MPDYSRDMSLGFPTWVGLLVPQISDLAIGGGLGFYLERSKAFDLKLKAQRALTQVAIANNVGELRRELAEFGKDRE